MHHHHHHQKSKSLSGLRLAFFLNLGFTVIEIVGGLLTNSIAIVADAVHDLGDSLALGIAWWFENIARKSKADDIHSYGYGRVSLLAALVNAVVLTAGATIVITQAVPRIFSPQTSHAEGMMGLALLGIAVNGFAAWKTSRGSSINEKVVSLHLFEDVLGWAAILIGALVLKFTGWLWIDPVLAIGIAGFVIINISRKLWEIGRIFLQLAPGGIDIGNLRKEIEALKHVREVHHLHAWSIDGERHVLTLHVGIETGSDHHEVKSEIRAVISERDFCHITIELDEGNEDCSMS